MSRKNNLYSKYFVVTSKNLLDGYVKRREKINKNDLNKMLKKVYSAIVGLTIAADNLTIFEAISIFNACPEQTSSPLVLHVCSSPKILFLNGFIFLL